MKKSEEFKKQFAEYIITQLKQGVNPWKQPWTPSLLNQHNGHSHKAYRGSNLMLLSWVAKTKGYKSGAWLTYKQAKDKGGNVKAGERGHVIVYWLSGLKRVTGIDSEGNEATTFKRTLTPLYSTVFNLDQCENIKLTEGNNKQIEDFCPIKDAEAIMDTGCDYVEDVMGKGAYYRPSTDTIHLPDRHYFESEQAFYGVALHEKVHSTGHASRLKRPFVGHFGTPDYAKEELVAEIGSWLLCSQLGFNTVSAKDNHLSYLKSWLSVLTKDYTELYKAIEKGQQACEYLLKEAGLSTSSTPTVTSKELIVRPKGELVVVAA